ncbi:cysteine proteinase [Saitoella complicata NRRL Y-17804]|uniref:cysteine proteinase n=1 Tax=Saitoella complicata (strain BCRC 22490 / CBS 7301 / JCM 7358 / NBRC 10748 / NRRL Y-17804) TaxID=698492 RepID=UPI0008670A9A|nr:cysteine proteinase [Saitoella complicata NRRL Y-17804]ODQ51365.1 cysteine proteinase [Saitoella complicata NRRL Y-17804]
MSDFSDDLVREFYRKQCKDDPENESHYFDALRAIAQDRATEELSVLLAEEESKDKVGYQDTIRAYDLLGITPDVSDEFVTVYYETKLSDLPERKQELRHALETIAKFRKSAVLKHYVQHGRREHDIVMEDAPMELDMAYATLNITDRNAPDEVVVSVYDIAVGDAPAQMDEFTRALRAIGEARKSEAIVLYLANRGGVVDEALLAPLIPSVDLTCPVGLENIGNTCYLNSLLQYYFTIKPLRQAILVSVESGNIEVDVQANENGVTEKRVGGRAVSKKEIERAVRFVTQLSGLFKSMIASTESAITPERDVAYLALVSSRDEEDDEKIGKEPAPGLDHSEAATKETTVAPLASEVPEAEAVDGEKLGVTNEDTRSESSHTVLGEDEVPGEEEKDFFDPQPPTLPARPTAHQRQSSVMFGRQQDVTECIDNVMFQIEAALKPASVDSDGEQVDIVKELFYGKTKQLLVDMDMEKSTGSIEERRAAKEERFAHLIVDVHKDGRDIYNALDSIFDAQSVDLDGKQIRRQITVSQLPPILQIQIQRVQFDRATGQVYKSNAYLKFGETLYMDRYLDTADENIQARREASWKWKAKLEKLEARKHELVQTETRPLPIYEALEKTRAYLETMRDKHGMDVDPFILRTLEDEAKRVKAELETIEERITELQSRVNQQFTDLRAHGYRLHSVFIHRGSAAFGHYWIYIYDFARGVWRKYNDQYVTEVGVEEVLRDTTGDTASPYLLTYVKEGTEGEVVEAVKREVPQ